MKQFTSGIVLFIISLFLILLGVFFTITLVFLFFGIPLIIIGTILMITSILTIIFGTAADILTFLARPNKKPKKRSKIIEVKKVGEVYKKVSETK